MSEQEKKRHVHADLIIWWAECPSENIIQLKCDNGQWVNSSGGWHVNIEYRKKPTDKELRVEQKRLKLIELLNSQKGNVKLQNSMFHPLQSQFGYHRVNDDQQSYIDGFITAILNDGGLFEVIADVILTEELSNWLTGEL